MWEKRERAWATSYELAELTRGKNVRNIEITRARYNNREPRFDFKYERKIESRPFEATDDGVTVKGTYYPETNELKVDKVSKTVKPIGKIEYPETNYEGYEAWVDLPTGKEYSALTTMGSLIGYIENPGIDIHKVVKVDNGVPPYYRVDYKYK